LSAFAPAAWLDFFVAEAGASAALTGLVIVAVSINLSVIIKTSLLTGRAAETITFLGGVLVLATFGMVPGQPLWLLGCECLAVALGIGGVTSTILFRARSLHHPQEMRWLRLFFVLAASLPLAAAGISLLAGAGGGLYWLVPGVVAALLGGIINSWILLVEILR
jgi:modulator of FtsH protease